MYVFSARLHSISTLSDTHPTRTHSIRPTPRVSLCVLVLLALSRHTAPADSHPSSHPTRLSGLRWSCSRSTERRALCVRDGPSAVRGAGGVGEGEPVWYDIWISCTGLSPVCLNRCSPLLVSLRSCSRSPRLCVGDRLWTFVFCTYDEGGTCVRVFHFLFLFFCCCCCTLHPTTVFHFLCLVFS